MGILNYYQNINEIFDIDSSKVNENEQCSNNDFLINESEKENNYVKINLNKPGDFSNIDLDNIILCLKRDLLLKECSVYFNELYFNDKNFETLIKSFNCNFENNKKIKLKNEMKKFKYPIKLKI